MPTVSEFALLRHELRLIVRDESGFQWSDAALDAIINHAQREYSLYSGKLCGECDVFFEGSDVHVAPEDFIEPLKFVDDKSRDISIVSWRYLNELYPDFRKINGSALEFVCFDFDGYGKFRTFPHLSANGYLGKLYYRRSAHDDVLENCNEQAVKNHCLYQMFLFSGKSVASNYWNEFIDLVNKESRSNIVLKNRQEHRLGSFY